MKKLMKISVYISEIKYLTVVEINIRKKRFVEFCLKNVTFELTARARELAPATTSSECINYVTYRTVVLLSAGV